MSFESEIQKHFISKTTLWENNLSEMLGHQLQNETGKWHENSSSAW